MVTRDVYTVGYSYDQAGNVTGMTYPDGLQAGYTYNGLNQPVSVSDGVAELSYDDAGNRIGETLLNGVNVTYGYDRAGRLTVIESVYGARTIAESACTLDNVGNRLFMTDAGGRTTRHTYDKDYELTGVRYPDGQREEYTYDPAGNRTSEDGTGYVYDPDNHLVSAGHDPYLYDENGNLVYGNRALYLYDDDNRLTNVLALDGFKDIQYAYDGDGTRTSRTVSNLLEGDSGIQSAINRELAHLLIPQTNSGKGNGLPWPGLLNQLTGPAGRMNDGLPGILQDIGVPPGLFGNGIMGSRGSVSHEVYGPPPNIWVSGLSC